MDANTESSLLSEVADHRERIENLEREVATLFGKQINLAQAVKLILTAAKVEYDKLKEGTPNEQRPSEEVPGGLPEIGDRRVSRECELSEGTRSQDPNPTVD
jgi:hypothetical protein